MRRWKVLLPGKVFFTMESDDPSADLIAQGYDEFGLMEITGMDRIPDIPRPRMRRNKKPPNTGGRKGKV